MRIDHRPAAPPPADDFDRNLKKILQSTVPPTPENVRLKHFIDVYRNLYPHPSLLQQLSNWLALPGWLPARALVAIATLVIVVQGIFIARLLPEAETDIGVYRGTAIKCGDGPRIRAVFKPEAQHAEVIILMRKIEATLVGGPAENGELYLKVPKGRSIDEALALLKSSALVDEAMIVEPTDTRCP